MHRTLAIAVVVGPILTLINQGEALFEPASFASAAGNVGEMTEHTARAVAGSSRNMGVGRELVENVDLMMAAFENERS